MNIIITFKISSVRTHYLVTEEKCAIFLNELHYMNDIIEV